MSRWGATDDGEDEDEETIPCPYCRRPLHEDSQRCPHCESYISEEDAPAGPKPFWLVLGVLAGLAAAALWLFRG